jgi:hypothetical protein
MRFFTPLWIGNKKRRVLRAHIIFKGTFPMTYFLY